MLTQIARGSSQLSESKEKGQKLTVSIKPLTNEKNEQNLSGYKKEIQQMLHQKGIKMVNYEQ